MTPLSVIQTEVARQFHLRRDDIVARDNRRHCVWPRQIAMWLAVELTGLSPRRIGVAFERDRTTISHGVTRGRELLEDFGHLRVKALTALQHIEAQKHSNDGVAA